MQDELPSLSSTHWLAVLTAVVVGGLVLPVATAGAVVFGSFVILIRKTASYWSLPEIWPLIAATIPLAVGAGNIIVPFMPESGDVVQYHQAALLVAEHVSAGDFRAALAVPEATQVKSYALLIGTIYALTVSHPLPAVALNSGLWGLTVLVWLRIAQMLWGERTIQALGVLFVLYPAPVRFMSRTLRDSVPLFLSSVVVWALVRWLRDESGRGVAFGIGAAVPLLFIRVELVPPLCIGIFVGWLYKHRADFNRRRLTVSAVVLAVLGPAFVWLDRNFGPGFFPISPAELESLRSNLAKGPNPYLVNIEYKSWLDVLLYFPVRLFYLMFSPFPWEVASYALLLAVTDALFAIPLVVVAVFTLVRWRSVVRTETVFAVGYAFVVVAGYSLVVSSKGASSRRRLYAIPAIMLIASYGLVRLFDRWYGSSTNRERKQKYRSNREST